MVLLLLFEEPFLSPHPFYQVGQMEAGWPYLPLISLKVDIWLSRRQVSRKPDQQVCNLDRKIRGEDKLCLYLSHRHVNIFPIKMKDTWCAGEFLFHFRMWKTMWEMSCGCWNARISKPLQRFMGTTDPWFNKMSGHCSQRLTRKMLWSNLF